MTTTPPSSSLTSGILRFLDLLWLPGEVRELRVPKDSINGGTASGYFESAVGMAHAATKWDGDANLYFTLNPAKPDLLSRAANKIVTRARITTSDSEIVERRWLFLDLDPVRKGNTSSTDEELAAAEAMGVQITEYLRGTGWPEPVVAMSGNGLNLIYRVDLPNDDESKLLIRNVLVALAEQFNNDQAHVDIAVSNASRLIGLIGTTKVKGQPTAARPHRRSLLRTVPDELLVVPSEALHVVASPKSREYPALPVTTFSGVGVPPRLTDILDQHGIKFHAQPPDANGVTWYHVEKCPFHDDECKPFECGVGQSLPDGPYAGHCFHSQGVGKGWQEWKVALGIDPAREGTTPRATASEHQAMSAVGYGPIRRTDTGNAHRLINENLGDILWCEVLNRWLVYDGTRYAEDETREVERRAERTVRGMYQLISQMTNEGERKEMAKWAIQSENRGRIRDMVESAKRMAPVHPNDLDTDSMLFNVVNGTIDLRTQRIRAHNRADLLAKRANVAFDPSAECPLWSNFLDRIFAGNEDIIAFVRRLFGYCLTGLLTEQIIVFLYGTGANGKSTLLRTTRALMGDYSYHSRPEVFMSKRGDTQGFELVNLAGSRLVTSTETGARRQLDEGLVKEMTGGEPITCAPKYGAFFSYQPVFKPLLATNHRPQIKGADEGIWRRVLLVPFTVTLPKDEWDLTLYEKLIDELPGILNWTLQGVAEFLEGGLNPPSQVMAATKAYRDEQDALSGWLEENCVLREDATDVYAELYKDYVAWCATNGDDAMSKGEFSSSLDQRGCESHRGAKGKRMRLRIARKGVVGDG